MNAELVRGLVRMGFFVGVHTEHGHDMATLDEIVDALAAPIVQAMGDEALSPSGFASEPCPSIHVDGGRRWHQWVDPKLETRQ